MLINTIRMLNDVRTSLSTKKVGFVPTMGNLHSGHLSLIQASLKDNDITFVSIFVNPKQFGPKEDYNKYPRTLEEDLRKIEALSSNKNIWVYAPKTIEDIYPKGWDLKIETPLLANRLCGKSRPEHFSGVCTVVYRLFNLVKPNNAYFGEKDYQQCLIIKKMVKDLDLPINIKTLPIARESDGLALSSRNQFLSEEQRQEALQLNKTLNEIKDYIKNSNIDQFQKEMKGYIEDKLDNDQWEYLEVLDAGTLELATSNCENLVTLGALKLGNTRLIDNVVFKC